MKRRIIIELESELAGFGRPPLKEEGGLYQIFTSISASDLSRPDITVRYHPSEPPADLANFIEEIVVRIYGNDEHD